jgi:hypothetical protein
VVSRGVLVTPQVPRLPATVSKFPRSKMLRAQAEGNQQSTEIERVGKHERARLRSGPKPRALITATLVRASRRSRVGNPFRTAEVAGACQDFLSEWAAVVEGPARNRKRTSELATCCSLNLAAKTRMAMKFRALLGTRCSVLDPSVLGLALNPRPCGCRIRCPR